MLRNARPPRTARRPVTLHRHGHRRVDPYFWLRERDDPAVLEHLASENAYVSAVLADTETLQQTLFDEIRGRMADDKSSPPVRDRGYWYWSRYAAGAEYATYWRGRSAAGDAAELLLDGPALAAGHDYFAIGDVDISADERWLAYTVDTSGRRLYELFLRDLAEGKTVATGINAIAPGIVFANDNETLFVVVRDPETLREYRVDRLTLRDSAVVARASVFTEADTTYLVEVGRTTRRDFVVITASTTLTTEHWLLPGDDPAGEPALFLARRPGHEHSLDFDGEYFWLLSNLDAPNGRLCRTRPDARQPDAWETVVAEERDAQLEDFAVFDGYLVLELTKQAASAVDIVALGDLDRHRIAFDEPVYSVGLDENPMWEARHVRLVYESMTRPPATIDVDLASHAQTIVHVEPVRGDFRAGNYVTERLWVDRDDGARVPVSILRRADLDRSAATDILLYGYGAYGYGLEPRFSVAMLSLVDRGFLFAIAHVRGGSELGQAWYEGGRKARKHASFDDFNAVADALANYGGGAVNRLYAMGGSAGGLLVGAALNRRPERFVAVVAQVPFVDVVTTMLDESIPLTTFEYEEWGDPRRAPDYHTMLAYSPYDNVSRASYPHILITSGLHDSQVQYWEPAKWAARLRERNRATTHVLLHTEMEAGHGGRSGRYQSLAERCLVFAFLLAVKTEADQ